MKSCRSVRAAILRECDRELSLERALEIDAHVGACAACREFQERAAELDELLHGLGDAPLERLDVERNVREVARRIAAERDAAPARSTLRTLRNRRVAAAAAVLFACIGAIAVWRARSMERRDVRTDPLVSNDAPTIAPEPTHEAETTASDASALDAEPAFDAQRLAQAEAQLRELLARHATLLPAAATSAQATAFAAAIDAERRDSELASWPVARIAALLADDADREIARAALRYIGARGDSVARFTLESACERDDVAFEALYALFDLGELGVEPIARLLSRDWSRDAALAALERWPAERALRALCAAVRTESHDELLDAFARYGESAIEPLLELAGERAIELERSIEVLAELPGAGETVAVLIAERRAFDPDVLLAACARLQPEGALPWIAERCRASETRTAALASLAQFRSPAAFELRIDLMRERDSSDSALDSLASDAIRDGDVALVDIAARCASTPQRASVLLDALVAHADAAAVPGLAQFAGAALLSASERELAMRAIADLGAPVDARWLRDVLAGLDPAERRLRAVCIDALYRLGGEAEVAKALGNAPRRPLERVLAALRERSPQSTSLVQLARALDLLFERELAGPLERL